MSDTPDMKDPERLDTTADPMLRDLLRAGRDELPNDAQLAVLAAKLGPIVGGGGGGGGAAGGAATKAAVAKTIAGATLAKVIGVVATVAIVGVAATRFTAAPSPHAVTPATTATATATPTPAANATANADPTPTPTANPTPTTPASPVAPPSAFTPDPDAETKLLSRAQSDLATNPTRALAEANEMARRFPRGEFAPEREVVAIDALSRLGRRDEANARATRFAATFPQSPYRRRVDAILER